MDGLFIRHFINPRIPFFCASYQVTRDPQGVILHCTGKYPVTVTVALIYYNSTACSSKTKPSRTFEDSQGRRYNKQ